MGIRVAHFVQRFPPAMGGSESYFARLGEYIANRGDKVVVFTTVGDSLESFWSTQAATFNSGNSPCSGGEVRRFRLSMRFRGRRWLLKPLSLFPHRNWQCLTAPCNPFSWEMWQSCARRGHQFDLVHATAFPYAFPILCGRRLARQLGVPFLLTPFLHLGDPQNPHDATGRAYTSSALMELAKSADVVFAQTPSERAALLAHGVEAGKVVLQGLGVDARECTGGNRGRARLRWGAGEDEVVIGHLANNSAQKGTIDLLKAAALLSARNVRFKVVLAGPQMANFRSFWQTLSVTFPILILGPVTDEEKRDFFAGIDVFALPSRSDSFGLVLLEAWANGVPNVCYRAGGIADLVRNDIDGLLVPCGNIEALADALQRLALNPDLRLAFGKAGQQRVHSDFRWEDKLALVRSAYQIAIVQYQRRDGVKK